MSKNALVFCKKGDIMRYHFVFGGILWELQKQRRRIREGGKELAAI